jgi:hypothetical protein
VSLYSLDVFSIFSDLILTDGGEINPVYWNQLFWDDVHPTENGHTILAGEAYNVLQGDPIGTSPIPIPPAAWLLGTGFVGIIGVRKRFSPGNKD